MAVLVLSQATLSEHVLIDSSITKNVYIYKHGENHKTNAQLNFTNGDWYYLPSFRRLEFHTRTPGMLDFNIAIKSFYKVLYLNGSKRVLVFPQEPNGPNKRRPFVDWSMSDRDEDLVKIFPEKEEDLGNAEKLNVAFNGVTADSQSILEMVFGEEKKELIKEWNYLPFFDPTNDYSLVDPLTNKWALFKDFDQQLFKSLNLPTDKIMQKIKFLKLVYKDLVEKGVMKRLLKYVYYDDIELIFISGLTDENRLKVWHLVSTINSMMVNVRMDEEVGKLSQKKNQILKLEKQLKEPMLEVAKKMVILFMKALWPQFLSHFFDTSKDMTIDYKIYRNWLDSSCSPISPEGLQYHQQIYDYSLQKIREANEKETKDEANLEYKELGDLLHQAKDQFKQTMLEYFRIYIPAIKRGWESKETIDKGKMDYVEEDNELAPALKLMRQAGVDDDGKLLKLEKKFDVNKPDEEYIREFESVDFDRLFDDFMLQYYLGISNDLLFNYIFTQSVDNWNNFKDIGIDSPLGSFSAFRLAREFLYMFGGIPFTPELDLAFLKYDSEKIFNYKEDRVII